MFNRLGYLIFKIKEKRKFQHCDSIFNYMKNHFSGHEYISIDNDVWIGENSWITAFKLSGKNTFKNLYKRVFTR